MTFLLSCPNCGSREQHEFWFGGEDCALPDDPANESLDANFERVWLRDNVFGVQVERWFHFGGCGRWITVGRDTRTDAVATAPNGSPRTPRDEERNDVPGRQDARH